jgi:hypothetical protein
MKILYDFPHSRPPAGGLRGKFANFDPSKFSGEFKSGKSYNFFNLDLIHLYISNLFYMIRDKDKYRWIPFFFFLVSFFFAVQAQHDPALYNHPELDWSTFETEHFVVHFHQGTRRTAELVGNIAEDIYYPLTNLYQYQPKGKVHFIIRDTDDISNGASYFFDNKIEIWAENMDYIMRGTKNWLRDVVTHEFTHMIQIQKSMKFPRTTPYGFFQIFGYEPEKRRDVVLGFPNTVVSYPILSINLPMWFAEGTAQHQATGARFDYRDPNREMVLRDRVIYGNLLNFKEMGVFGETSHQRESVYNMGFAFVNYLCDRFGEDILEKISEYCSKLSVLTFNQALEKATNYPADTLYLQWKKYLEDMYHQRLKTIKEYEIKGTAIEIKGSANLYPIWSPDGTKIAYTSNEGSNYFSQNQLIIYDCGSKKKKAVASLVTSSVSWSPDGRYIVCTRPSWKVISGGSLWNDLYLYDSNDDKLTNISRGMRAKNPAWSHDGKKIVFVTETNGLNQLCILELDNQIHTEEYNQYYFDRENGVLVAGKDQVKYSRTVKVKTKNLVQLRCFFDGRQIYRPRWSPDDKRIIFDTSKDYARDIALYDLEKDTVEFVLTGKEELRYPVFHPSENAIYYVSAETGIYNIYKYYPETAEKILLTNVTGGAVMPDINSNNELVYSCYDSLGYHIYTIHNEAVINPDHASYQENYLAMIPDKNFDDSSLPERNIKSYKQRFTGIHILPRLLIDYGTVKPGLYLISEDVLSQMSLIGGADINVKGDYDLFGLFEFKKLDPTIFLEAYNLSQNVPDTLMIRTGENFETTDLDINFDLAEFQVGFYRYFTEYLKIRLAYVHSLYHARMKWFEPEINDIAKFRYRYLNGRAWRLSISSDQIKYDHNMDINPSGGRYLFFRYSYENNDFMTDIIPDENYFIKPNAKFKFNIFELNWEEYFANPLVNNHALTLQLQAGYIDKNTVDDFFHLYGGGLLGMKGYSYFSFGGTKKLIGSVTYRFPLFHHMDWQLFNIYFNKLYFALFYDYGNAWVKDDIDFKSFKRDIGLQLRLETFSNYMIPTRLFFEAVYPVDEVSWKEVNYSNDWRFYFGLLFSFNFRQENRSGRMKIKR